MRGREGGYPQMQPDDLSPLIADIDTLRRELGFARWSNLRPWCDQADPLTCDRGGLERLLERLCGRWADGIE